MVNIKAIFDLVSFNYVWNNFFFIYRKKLTWLVRIDQSDCSIRQLNTSPRKYIKPQKVQYKNNEQYEFQLSAILDDVVNFVNLFMFEYRNSGTSNKAGPAEKGPDNLNLYKLLQRTLPLNQFLFQ